MKQRPSEHVHLAAEGRMRPWPLSGRRRGSRPRSTAVLVVAAALVVAALAATGRAGPARHAAGPQRGGTLSLLGQSDIFNLDTTSGYYTVNWILYRAYARQLVSYPNSPSFKTQIKLVADAATVVPSTANGGITAGGKTYTLHIRPGVKWNSSPPRQVTAGDFVREFKMLCNPVSPTGAPGYFLSTIVGMKGYCDGFAKVKGIAPAIEAYVNGHGLAGVAARGPLTIVFKLVKPAPDFLNILGLSFSSARPVEYMKYVPDSAQMRQHTLSDGPYEITSYSPGKEFQLARNPAWDPKTDPLRRAYVDKITVTEGLTSDSVQQQLEAGTGDMEWDVTPPSQDLPQLVSANDDRLIIGPTGPYYVALQVYLALNQYAGPMKNKLVRQAVEYAVDKNAVVQIYGGPRIAAPATQVILPGSVGFIPRLDPYSSNDGGGDPEKAKELLAKAGYPDGLDIKLLYSTTDPSPRVAQSLQASLGKAGFKVKLIPATQSDFYGKYMLNPSAAKRGVWDIAPPGWIPDWFGNNGRSVVQPLFTNPGNGSSDFGGYESRVTNAFVDKALTASSEDQAESYWKKANAQLLKDAATVPVEIQKWPLFHSSRVHGCEFWILDLNCDPTNVWLEG